VNYGVTHQRLWTLDSRATVAYKIALFLMNLTAIIRFTVEVLLVKYMSAYFETKNILWEEKP